MRNKYQLSALFIPMFFVQLTFAQQKIMGKLSAAVLNEVSGMAVSSLHQNIAYVHNDSFDSSRFFAISNTGELLTTYYFKTTANNNWGVLDCEDIATGPGPEKGQHYIYLADIGDNFSLRKQIQVYRFKEPPATKAAADTINAALLNLSFPNGPHDAETIMIDPKQKLLYIISKREDSVGIYSCTLNFKSNDKIILKQQGKIFFEGNSKMKWIVAGDISKDGTQVILKSLEKVYYWKRNGNEPIYQTLKRIPVIQKNFITHGQQEAIAFAPDGKGYYVMAEGKGTEIYYYTIEN